MEIQLWKKILTPYELAVQEILVKFNHIIMEYRSADMYSPIEAVNGRVKSISSILEKFTYKYGIPSLYATYLEKAVFPTPLSP